MLDEDAGADGGRRGRRARACEAVAIALLHSYANPEHEQRVAEIVRERVPGEDVT